MSQKVNLIIIASIELSETEEDQKDAASWNKVKQPKQRAPQKPVNSKQPEPKGKALTKKPRNFQSYKEDILGEEKTKQPVNDTECWVDDEDDEQESVKPVEDNNDAKTEKPVNPNQLPPNQSKKDKDKKKPQKSGAPGRSVYQMTKDEIEKKQKLKAGRAIQTKKKGGHHDRKAKAAKKHNV